MFKNRFTIFLLSTLCMCLVAPSYSQGTKRIQIKNAKVLKSGNYEGQKINRLLGDVKLKHDGKTMTCDSAYIFGDGNKFLGFSNVFIKETRKRTISGDFLDYNGSDGFAIVKGNAILIRDETKLETPYLNYNLESKSGIYTGGGILTLPEKKLTSRRGRFFEVEERYIFLDSVVLIGPDYVIEADSIAYFGKTEETELMSPTHIFSADQYMYAEEGRYNLEIERGYFKVNSFIESEDNLFIGDSIFLDNSIDFAEAHGNIFIYAKKDSVSIIGDEAYRYGQELKTMVTGHAYLQQVGGGDTMNVTADTLISMEDSITNKVNLIGFDSVVIHQPSFQALCDSLFYSQKDSTMYLHYDPICWNEFNQITADTVTAFFANEELDKIITNSRSFIISQDTADIFNQVKGKNMTAYFDSSQIDHVVVDGSGESNYYARNDDNKIVGMNYVICSEMDIKFDSNQVSSIVFLRQPDARFIPPKDLTPQERRLKGFDWQISRRPEKISFNVIRSISVEAIDRRRSPFKL